MLKRIIFALLLPICALMFAACTPKQPDATTGSTQQSEEQPATPLPEPTPAPEPAPETPGRPAAKEFTIWLEGMEEKVEWTLYEGEGFSLYYDAEGLSDLTETAEGFKAAAPQDLPVWLAVTLFKYAIPQVAGMEEIILGGYQAWFTHTVAGNKFDSEVRDQYIIETPNGGYILMELCYFLEASEGWGVRLAEMLATIEFE